MKHLETLKDRFPHLYIKPLEEVFESHDELLEACKSVIASKKAGISLEACLRVVEEAIAKAEGV